MTKRWLSAPPPPPPLVLVPSPPGPSVPRSPAQDSARPAPPAAALGSSESSAVSYLPWRGRDPRPRRAARKEKKERKEGAGRAAGWDSPRPPPRPPPSSTDLEGHGAHVAQPRDPADVRVEERHLGHGQARHAGDWAAGREAALERRGLASPHRGSHPGIARRGGPRGRVCVPSRRFARGSVSEARAGQRLAEFRVAFFFLPPRLARTAARDTREDFVQDEVPHRNVFFSEGGHKPPRLCNRQRSRARHLLRWGNGNATIFQNTHVLTIEEKFDYLPDRNKLGCVFVSKQSPEFYHPVSVLVNSCCCQIQLGT